MIKEYQAKWKALPEDQKKKYKDIADAYNSTQEAKVQRVLTYYNLTKEDLKLLKKAQPKSTEEQEIPDEK